MTRDVQLGRRFAATALMLWMLAVPGAAQDVVLDLSLPASAKAATLQVPASGGSLPLTLVKTGAKATKVKVVVTPFLSEAGERLAPLLSTGSSSAGTTELTIDVQTQQLSNANLVVPRCRAPVHTRAAFSWSSMMAHPRARW
jgi:hypothetical protein